MKTNIVHQMVEAYLSHHLNRKLAILVHNNMGFHIMSFWFGKNTPNGSFLELSIFPRPSFPHIFLKFIVSLFIFHNDTAIYTRIV